MEEEYLMNTKLKEILETMEEDMKYNRQTIPADYPYVKIMQILKVLTHKNMKK